ncbi:membrane protein insertion efficiency factor YidD [Polyangium aurulentum]|uniref:membrane protein insertion efficiency factor YidD n=1 Tax=Polyangium aurulentum TaxID=2567896 RepID=UPI0010AE1F82|nr:membrane protein insertion efficiency factor YidD [Polyangium aurulentum]UQA59211.1 membrane protein insertion efficiency factor YidD [Polyangium aurulentum]
MLAKLLLALIRVYQLTLSKLFYAIFGPVCRFEPSCSRYAAACIAGQGALRGSLLSVKRLCKCHPFHPGGYDPPPPPRIGRTKAATGLSDSHRSRDNETPASPRTSAAHAAR